MRNCLLLIYIFISVNCHSQNKFFIQTQVAPKITINNNSGVNVYGWYLGPGNGPDSRSALSLGVDFSATIGYNVNKKSSVSVGIGLYKVNQIYRPFDGAGFRIGQYRNIHMNYQFLTIPLTYEYKLYNNSKFAFYGGLHLSFVGDVFKESSGKKKGGNLIFKNGDTDPNTSWYYFRNYLNMQTFNFLYGFSLKTDYKINKKISVFGSAQFMQGFRPLITSGVTFVVDSAAMSHSISSTNGQGIMLNLGIRYNF